MYALVTKHVMESKGEPNASIPNEVNMSLHDFSYLTLDEFPAELPLIQDL